MVGTFLVKVHGAAAWTPGCECASASAVCAAWGARKLASGQNLPPTKKGGSFAAALVVLAAIKLIFLLVFHPIETPDTGGYDAVATAIAAGTWASPVPMAGPAPMALFRMPGYPAVLAVAGELAGDHARWLVVALQNLLSLAAAVASFGLARKAGLAPRLSALVMVVTGLALPLLLDLALLTDSLNASLLCFILCLLAGRVLTGRPLAPLSGLLAGLALAACFLMREGTIYLAVVLLPLALAAAWPLKARQAVAVILFFAPLLATHQAYVAWNRLRTGAAITTTGAQTTMVYALVKAARHDMAVFDGDTALDRVARRTLKDKTFDEVQLIVTALYDQEGRNAVSQSGEAFAVFFRAWRQHPLAMIRVPLDHMRANQAQLILRPVESLREVVLWAWTTDHDIGRWRTIREGKWWNAPLVAVDGLCKAVAITVFAAFTLLTPWRAWRERLGTPMARAGLGVWLFYFGLLGTYALVSLETRYMAGAVPASAVFGLANILWLARRHGGAR